MGKLKNIKEFEEFINVSEYNFSNYKLISDLARKLVKLDVNPKLAMQYAEDYVSTKSSRARLLDKLKGSNKQAYDLLYNMSDEIKYKGLLKGVDWEE